jgi:hypothetical protein
VAGVLLLAVACAVGSASHRALELARRNKVGAESEDAVRHALSQLTRQGWEVRNGVPWPGGGDIDHLVRGPRGVGFAIETKTHSFDERHLARTRDTAAWAAGARRRYPLGVVPVLCVVRSRGLEHCYGGVEIISIDRLVPTLHRLAAEVELQQTREAARLR